MEKFSFSIFSLFYGVFATFWLSGTSSRTVNAAKSLDFPVKFYQTLSQTHEKTQNFQKLFFSHHLNLCKVYVYAIPIWSAKYNYTKNIKNFFYDLIFWLWVLLSHSPPQTWQMSRSEPKSWKIMIFPDFRVAFATRTGGPGGVARCHLHGLGMRYDTK